MKKKKLKKLAPPAGAKILRDERAFGEETLDFTIPELENPVDPKSNQDKDPSTRMACTIFWPVNQIIRLFRLDLTEEESNKLAKSAMEYCKREWGFTGNGRFSSLGTIFTVKWRNNEGRKEFDKPEVVYFALSRGSEKLKEALSKGHLIGFTYNDDRFSDAYADAVVDEDVHLKFWGHRTNLSKPVPFVPHYSTWNKGYEVSVYDNYYSYFNEYYIKNVEKYLAKGIDTSFYLILPKDSLGKQAEKKIEEAKTNIKQEKSANALLGVLTSTRSSLPNQQKAMAELAKSLRSEYQNARPLEQNPQKKVMQAVADFLSYGYKYADEESKVDFAELAKKLRKKRGVK